MLSAIMPENFPASWETIPRCGRWLSLGWFAYDEADCVGVHAVQATPDRCPGPQDSTGAQPVDILEDARDWVGKCHEVNSRPRIKHQILRVEIMQSAIPMTQNAHFFLFHELGADGEAPQDIVSDPATAISQDI